MNETEIAMRVRHALNEGAVHLDYKVSLRLEQARRAALARHAPEPQARRIPVLRLRAAGDLPDGSGGWGWRLGIAAPLLALALGFVGIYQWRTDQMVAEMADLDFAMLIDDTPIDTWAHRGFGVMLHESDATAPL